MRTVYDYLPYVAALGTAGLWISLTDYQPIVVPSAFLLGATLLISAVQICKDIREARRAQPMRPLDESNAEPPWTRYPGVDMGWIGFRQSEGEVYMQLWTEWIEKLSAEDRADYQSRNPEPPGWEGFWEMAEERIADCSS